MNLAHSAYHDGANNDDRSESMTYSTELVLTTIFSFVAASLWVEFTKRSVAQFFDNESCALLLTSVIITLFAIVLLSLVFGRKKKKSKDNKQ